MPLPLSAVFVLSLDDGSPADASIQLTFESSFLLYCCEEIVVAEIC